MVELRAPVPTFLQDNYVTTYDDATETDKCSIRLTQNALIHIFQRLTWKIFTHAPDPVFGRRNLKLVVSPLVEINSRL